MKKVFVVYNDDQGWPEMVCQDKEGVRSFSLELTNKQRELRNESFKGEYEEPESESYDDLFAHWENFYSVHECDYQQNLL